MLIGSRLISYFLSPYAHGANEAGAKHMKKKAPAVRQVALRKEIHVF